MNVLAACDFDLNFTYVMAGWEGTAGDGKLYDAALRKGLRIDEDKYDIMDSGFALTTKSLTPYRGKRYHLKEFARGRRRPQTKEELFNLRHAQLRNVVERIFGVLKKRFPVLVTAVEYDYKFQVDLVLALCMLHNFIRRHGHDTIEQEVADEVRRQNEEHMGPNDVPLFSEALESSEAKMWRDQIAQDMWNQYRSTQRARRNRNS
ncbi:hypothetical protein AaE_008962 [Aphanomyces astaci]|uniref:DDE Tnp4 domain-containing protein n=1 Tax=Aphanomyces astaci TaxID=112090 RepID=A0A6A5A582_APHAT|nr:hypothetical protein AaE_008962 [Aphanomyces astaci]